MIPKVKRTQLPPNMADKHCLLTSQTQTYKSFDKTCFDIQAKLAKNIRNHVIEIIMLAVGQVTLNAGTFLRRNLNKTDNLT